MVLRCSLLGHDYGDPTVERDREERGSEVVVTVQQYEECKRCDKRHVISENTEVTSLTTSVDEHRPVEADPDQVEESVTPDVDEAHPTAQPASTEEPIGPQEEPELPSDDSGSAAQDSNPPTAEAPTESADDTSSRSAEDSADIPTDENGDPITDDGEILDDEPDQSDTDRAHGEWPDADDVGDPIGDSREPDGWPDADERNSAEDDDAAIIESDDDGGSGDDDAVIIESVDDGRSAEETTADEPVGLDAEPPTTESIEAQNDAETADPAPESGSGIERAAAAPTPTDGTTVVGDAIELRCPSCGYVAGPDRSSLRTGDICPECRKGYLSEHQP